MDVTYFNCNMTLFRFRNASSLINLFHRGYYTRLNIEARTHVSLSLLTCIISVNRCACAYARLIALITRLSHLLETQDVKADCVTTLNNTRNILNRIRQ